MSDIIEIYDTEILLVESQYGDVIEMVGSAIISLPSSGGGDVNSVNGQTGNVILNADDVGADIAGSALAVSEALQPQITTNTDAVAMLMALLSALQASKADLTYVNDQIANLVGTDAQTLATIQAITDALAENEGLLEALDQTIANRVRFDVATQALTALQKYNARTNIDAEEIGTAAMLISNITAASIGAATTAQGAKADSALQSADVAPVALSGSYNDLTNKPTIPVLPTLATVATSGSYTDLTNKPDLTLKQDKLPTTGTTGQFLAHDMTFKTPAGGGSSVVWVSAVDACSNVNAGIDVSNLYFAKINGFLAVKGYYFGIANSGSNINANSPLMTLKELYGVYCTTSSGSLRGLRNAVSGGTSFENYLLRSSGLAEVRSSAITYKFGDPVYWSDACLGLLVNP